MQVALRCGADRVGEGIARVAADRLIAVGQGLLVFAFALQRGRAQDVGPVQPGGQLDGLRAIRHNPGVVLLELPGVGAEEVGLGAARVEPDRVGQVGDGAFVIVLAELGIGAVDGLLGAIRGRGRGGPFASQVRPRQDDRRQAGPGRHTSIQALDAIDDAPYPLETIEIARTLSSPVKTAEGGENGRDKA